MKTQIHSVLITGLLSLSGVLIASAHFSQPALAQVSSVITAEEAAKLIEQNRNNPNFVVLDVRTADEYADGHIAGAQQLDFYDDQFAAQLAKLDKSKQYLLYCRSGARSGKTAELMSGLGFSQVKDIKGGITAWKEAKLPVTTAK